MARIHTFRPWSEAELEEARLLKAAGLNYARVAERLGRTLESTKGRLKRPRTRPAAPQRPREDDTGITCEDASRAYREATLKHLADIEAVHGPRHRWATHYIGHEPRIVTYHAGFAGSGCGSAAAMCAEVV